MKHKTKCLDIFCAFSLVCFLLVLVLQINLINYPFIYNFDESIFIIVSNLLNKYKLYDQVWYDHPLAFPWLLDLWFKLAGGPSLQSARYFVLLLSSLNIVIFYFLLRFGCSIFVSVIATGLLIVSLQYVPMSLIAYNDLPSIGFSLLSLFLLFLAFKKENRTRYLLYFFSALAFSFSLEVKLSGLTLIPSFLALIFLGTGSLAKSLKNILIWSGLSGIIFALFSVTFLPFSYQHTIAFQKNASAVSGMKSLDNGNLFSLIKSGLVYAPIEILMVVISVAFLLKSKPDKITIVPLLWLLFNLVRFSLVSPVWPTYYVYLAIPGIWLIALFLENLTKNVNLFQFFSRQTPKIRYPTVLGSAAILALFLQISLNTFKILSNRHPVLRGYTNLAKHSQPHPVEAMLSPFQNSGKVIVTDHPYYVTRFGLITPPETAVISRKRRETENINGEFMLKVIKKNNPDFVFLYRFEKQFLNSKDLSNYLSQNFVEYSFEKRKGKFYVSKKLAQDSPGSKE